MTAITGLGPTRFHRPPPRLRPGAAFHVPETDGPAPDAETTAATTAPLQAPAMPSLLSLQEAGPAAVADREARRHGQSMLEMLARLQRALLGSPAQAEGTASTQAAQESLEALASLVRAAPTPADPRLAAVQRAVLVRAAVELARAKVAASM